MATFSPKKIDLTSINNGLQFENGDGISAEAINAPIEASAFVQTLAENKPLTSSNGGDVSVSIVEKPYGPVFVFENLVSQQELHETQETVRNLETYTEHLDDLIGSKQDQLTIDTAVTEGSENPIASGAVYGSIQGVDERITEVETDLTGQIGGLSLELTSSLDRISLFSQSGSMQGRGVLIAQKADARLGTPISSKAVYEALLPLQDHQNEMQADIDMLYTLVEGTVVAHETIEDTFATRVTGGGIAVIDNTPTTVKKVQGSTKAVDGVLVNSTFSGIVSQNADGTTQDTLALPQPIELGAWDYIDIENQQIVRKTYHIDFSGDVAYSYQSANNTNFVFTIKGVPAGVAKQVVASHYTYGSSADKTIHISVSATTVTFVIQDASCKRLNENGELDVAATKEAYKAHFKAIGLQIAIGTANPISVETIYCPSTYTAWNNGTETIIGGDEATVTQEYYVKVGG